MAETPKVSCRCMAELSIAYHSVHSGSLMIPHVMPWLKNIKLRSDGEVRPQPCQHVTHKHLHHLWWKWIFSTADTFRFIRKNECMNHVALTLLYPIYNNRPLSRWLSVSWIPRPQWDAIVRVEQNLTNLTKVRACRVSCCAPCHRWSIMCATIAHGVLGFYHVMRLLVLFVSEHASEMGHGPSITTTTAVPEQEWS